MGHHGQVQKGLRELICRTARIAEFGVDPRVLPVWVIYSRWGKCSPDLLCVEWGANGHDLGFGEIDGVFPLIGMRSLGWGKIVRVWAVRVRVIVGRRVFRDRVTVRIRVGV